VIVHTKFKKNFPRLAPRECFPKALCDYTSLLLSTSCGAYDGDNDDD